MLGLYGTLSYAVYVYLCICVSVFVYLCMRHMVISVLISLDQVPSENIWFVWSKSSFSGDKKGCDARGRRTDGRTTECEDRARILETEFAIDKVNSEDSTIYMYFCICTSYTQEP